MAWEGWPPTRRRGTEHDRALGKDTNTSWLRGLGGQKDALEAGANERGKKARRRANVPHAFRSQVKTKERRSEAALDSKKKTIGWP